MRKITLKKTIIRNFAGTVYREIDYGEHTEISGRNESGKTTVGNAFAFAMYNKLMNGGRADGIRRKENGIEVNDVDIYIQLVFDIDGREVTIEKTQSQNWNKKTNTLIGNTNTYMVNGIPKKEKEFIAFLEETIAPEETIRFCTSAAPFLRLDSKKRREQIFKLIPDFSNDDVLALYPDLAPIAELLRDGTVEELIARCNYQLHGRGRGDKGLEGELDLIPVRIDEATKSYADVESIDAQDRILDSDILYLKQRLESLESEKSVDSRKEKADAIMRQMRTMESAAVSELKSKRMEAKRDLDVSTGILESGKRELQSLRMELESKKSSLARLTADINSQADEWKKCKSLEFDESKKVCAYCGSPLSAEKVAAMVTDFETKKALRLKAIEEEGHRTKEAIINLKNTISGIKTRIAGTEKTASDMEKKVAENRGKYSALPDAVAMDDDPEYSKLKAEYYSLIAEESTGDDNSAEITTLRIQISEKQSKRLELQSIILADSKARERTKELEKERVSITQRIADIQRVLDLLKEFSKRRGELITSRINAMFKFIEWDLFDFTIDGSSYTEICEPKYQGVRYSQLLNGGAKILTEADICNAFQKQNGISLPVFLDNAEAITAETRKKFDEFDFQTIFLSAAECDFTVETR